MAISAVICSVLLALGTRLEACQQERGGVQSLLQTPEKHGFPAWEVKDDVRLRIGEIASLEKKYTPCQSAVSWISSLLQHFLQSACGYGKRTL